MDSNSPHCNDHPNLKSAKHPKVNNNVEEQNTGTSEARQILQQYEPSKQRQRNEHNPAILRHK